MAFRILLALSVALLVIGFGLAWLPLAFIVAGLGIGAIAVVVDFEDEKPKVSR